MVKMSLNKWKWLLTVCLFFSLFDMYGLSQAAADSAPSKQETGNLTLVRERQAESVILWWSKKETEKTASFAATELQQYMKKMSGATIPVIQGEISEDDAAQLEQISSAVLIATGSEARTYTASGSPPTIPVKWLSSANTKLANLKGDSFAIETSNEHIVLAGLNNRGTLYAAYELLETIGVQFFSPNFSFYEGNAEFVPIKGTISVSIDVVKEPSFELRRKYVEEGWSHSAENLPQLMDWMSKNKLNTLVFPYDYVAGGETVWDNWRERLIPLLEQRDMIVEVGGHGFESFLTPQKYKGEHPDWFVPNYIVFNIANDDAVNAYVEEVVAYLRARPEIKIFDAWSPDDAPFPPSAIQKFGNTENAYAYVVNKLHAAVKKELPGVLIEAISYGTHIKPPSSQYQYDESIIMDMAPYSRSYKHAINDPASTVNRNALNQILQWREGFTGNLAMYEYYRRYAFFSMPVVFPQLIGQELPYYKSIGINSIGTYSEPFDWITYEITHYVLAKMSWDVEQNAQQLIADFVQARYGAATDEMSQYFKLVEEAGRELFSTVTGDFDNLTTVIKAREKYMEAKPNLANALARATRGSSSHWMIERLSWNLDYAIANIDAEYYRITQQPEKARLSKLLAQDYMFAHRYDGIMLQNLYSMRRWQPGITRENIKWSYDVNRRQLPYSPMVSSMGTHANNYVTNIVDNDENTLYWSNANPGIGDYVGVDLLSILPLNQIDILMGSNDKPNVYIRNGVVEVSTDFKQWTALATVQNEREIRIPVPKGTEARFVRLRSTAAQTQWIQVREFKVGISEREEQYGSTLQSTIDKVQVGEEFSVTFGVKGIASPVYAADITVEYDGDVLEYMKAIAVQEGLHIIYSSNENGKLRLLLASLGETNAILGTQSLMDLKFLATGEVAATNLSTAGAILGDKSGNEFSTLSASTSLEIIKPSTGLVEDVNQDGKVSVGDLAIVALHYGKDSSSPDWRQIKHADVNGDGKIDLHDLVAVASKM